MIIMVIINKNIQLSLTWISNWCDCKQPITL